MQLRALLLLLLVVFTAWPGVALDERLERRVRYQGRLEGSDGTTTLVVELFDDATGGRRVWGPEQHEVTPDPDGRFSIVIGASELDVCERAPDRRLICEGTGDGTADLDQVDPGRLFLAVSVVDDQGTTTLSPRQQLFPAFHAASTTPSVPIGTVLIWWGRTDDLPPGFELCDGAAPSTVGAVLPGDKPDLRSLFVRGAPAGVMDVAASPVGGGRDTKPTRSLQGTALTRSQLPNYTLSDSLSTNTAGSHIHTVNQNCASDDDGGSDTHYTMGDSSAGRTCPISRTAFGGSHGHTITGSVSLDGNGFAHNHSIAPQENRPAFLEVAYIIRVK